MSFCYLTHRYRVRDIPGFGGCFADSMGVIWSLDKHGLLRPVKYSLHRYRKVSIKGIAYRVHRLVLLAFHGQPQFHDYVSRHLNDNKTDNVPENLAWGTNAENMQDTIRNLGRHWRSTRADTNLIKDDQKIIQLIREWRTADEIAQMTGECRRYVYKVFHRAFPKGSHPWDNFKIRDEMRAKAGLPKIKRGPKPGKLKKAQSSSGAGE